MKNIYLTGMMGCGKTRIGSILAERTGLRMVDMDAVVESDTQKSIPEIFEAYGEDYFRALESNVLYDLSRLSGLIVSCGGGVVLRERNVRMMRESGTVVFIDRSVDRILSDIDPSGRPLLKKDGSNLREIYGQRIAIYRSTCDVEINNEGSAEEAAQKIMLELGL